MYKLSVCLIIASTVLVESAPGGYVAGGGEAAIGGDRHREKRQLIYFQNGTIGVNFLGFKASAGLGGLITGNWADGGLHAEAETPFGQRVGAGINGSTNADGTNSGYMYSYKNNHIVGRKLGI